MKKFLTLEQVKALSLPQAEKYASYLRNILVETVEENGGHLASNLGVVEISLALSRVLDLKKDRVVYDTGHQAYVHKLLTGRGSQFSTLRKRGGISGFPRREESEFDAFGTGHSGTALSAALGLQKAAQRKGEDTLTAVVIGDGSFGGGMVFEALNNISPTDRVIIILNDNKMSIDKSVGTLRSTFNKMRTPGYYKLKSELEEAFLRHPLLEKSLGSGLRWMKNTIKRQALPAGNFFEEMDLHYYGPANGHNLEQIELLLREAKNRKGPSVIHLCTKKGKGYAPAEEDPCRFHGLSPKGEEKPEGKSFSQIFGETVTSLAEKDDKILCITSAMTGGVGLSSFEKKFPDRLYDTGISEEHAMTFASGLAAGGMKPCLALYATFFQRALDQFVHDAALQKLPVVVCLDRAGITGEDGATHHGLFDLSFILSVPGVKLYAPISEKEMKRNLKTAFSEKDCPSVIRYPKGAQEKILLEHFPCEEEIEKLCFSEEKEEITLVTYSRMTLPSLLAVKNLSAQGVSVRLVRFSTLKGFDKEKLQSIFAHTKKILFVEEAVENGSFTQYLISLLRKEGLLDDVKIRTLFVGEKFIPHGNACQLLAEEGLSTEGIEKELYCLAKT